MFVYTRESHPAEDVQHHHSFARKLSGAALLRDETGISRDILVDDLAGTVHRAYGMMPNMTWVIGRGGRVAYKANWTSAPNVEAFLIRFLAARTNHSPATTAVMYETQQVEFRYPDRKRFSERLRRNGPRAAAEFEKAQQLWADRPSS